MITLWAPAATQQRRRQGSCRCCGRHRKNMLSTDREVYFSPFMLEHLVHAICVEACVAATESWTSWLWPTTRCRWLSWSAICDNSATDASGRVAQPSARRPPLWQGLLYLKQNPGSTNFPFRKGKSPVKPRNSSPLYVPSLVPKKCNILGFPFWPHFPKP